jgi:DNA-binding response OmpR family regulator
VCGYTDVNSGGTDGVPRSSKFGIPIASPAEAQINLSTEPKQIADVAPLRILIAEDNALIGMLLEQMLTAFGHDVCAVETTEKATVASAARHRPDLVIVDVGLRLGSGINAVQTILRSHFVAHIFVTGDRAAVQTHMPDAVILEKPFNEAKLERAIRTVIHAARGER